MKTTIHNYSKATIKKMIRQELEKDSKILLQIKEDEKKLNSVFPPNPNNHDLHVYALWRKYYPYIPPAYQDLAARKKKMINNDL